MSRFSQTIATVFLASAALLASAAPVSAGDTLSVVVMDPLAAPLSCPCVKGYAQRKYEKLAEHLEAQLRVDVRLTFAESLKTALKGEAKGQAHLVIGKHSVVLSDGKAAERKLRPIASLTDKDGLKTQTGLIVVPKMDPAKSVADLQDYRILFGPPECDEKHAAAIALLGRHSIAWKRAPANSKTSGGLETCSACSDGATKILEFGADVRAATVISSYAQPLLEGCGTIKKGDLRVIGETKPVPFVSAFVDDSLPKATQQQITAALMEVAVKPELCAALETLIGFEPYEPPAKKKR